VFDHVTIRAEDRAASERFYKTVLPTLGIEKTHGDSSLAEWDDFSIAQAGEDRPPHARPAHRVRGAVARARRRVLAGRDRGGLP
jgi:catechol 2,3-dioxygenase-like lactoylglutathione lyase family enzyme